MADILHIDTDIQLPNRIFKDSSNLISQITDKAQNIPFCQGTAANKPTYSYSGYFNGSNTVSLDSNKPLSFYFNRGLTIEFRYSADDTSNNCLLSCDTSGSRGWFFLAGNTGFSLYALDGTVFNAAFANTNVGVSHTGVVCIFPDGSIKMATDNLVLNGTTTVKTQALGTNTKMTLFSHCFVSSYNFNGKLYYFKITEGVKYPELSTLVANSYFDTVRTGFTFTRRYKEDGYKKLYFSSKFLEGASISSADAITRVYSAIDGRYISSGKVERSGFTNATTITAQITTNPYADVGLGTKDFIMCGWMFINGSQEYNKILHISECFIGFRYLGGNVLTYFKARTFDGSHRSTSGLAVINKWVHLCLVGKGQYLYFMINGTLLYIDYAPGSAPATSNCYIEMSSGNYRDDILFSEQDTIVDPSTHSVGQRVFQPPRRGGFDGIFKEF